MVLKKGLAEEVEKLKFDKRLQDWHVARGKFPKDELEKYLNSLPDLASNVETLSFGQASDSNGAGDGGATHQ